MYSHCQMEQVDDAIIDSYKCGIVFLYRTEFVLDF